MDVEAILTAVSTATARCLAKHEGVTVEDIWDSYAGALTPRELCQALRELVASGRLRREEEGTLGFYFLAEG